MFKYYLDELQLLRVKDEMGGTCEHTEEMKNA
jgi:hypothetical protein